MAQPGPIVAYHRPEPTMITPRLTTAILMGLFAAASLVTAQGTPPQQATPPAQQNPPATPPRPQPPTRDPNTAGFVTAKELPDGQLPQPTVEGNFIIGPTHNPAPETIAQDGVPKGQIVTFTMTS